MCQPKNLRRLLCGTYTTLGQGGSNVTGHDEGVTPEFLSNLKMAKQEVIGEIAYIAWSVEGMIALGTDTFVIRNGKIVAQTFAAV